MSPSTIDLIYNIIGTVGVGIIVLEYLLLHAEKVDKREFAYSFWNLVGALMIMVSLYRFWNFASFVIEIFWVAISLYGMFKYFRRKSYD